VGKRGKGGKGGKGGKCTFYLFIFTFKGGLLSDAM